MQCLRVYVCSLCVCVCVLVCNYVCMYMYVCMYAIINLFLCLYAVRVYVCVSVQSGLQFGRTHKYIFRGFFVSQIQFFLALMQMCVECMYACVCAEWFAIWMDAQIHFLVFFLVSQIHFFFGTNANVC